MPPRRFSLAALALAASLASAPAAMAQDSVTATGTGLTRVVPKNRHSNSSIAAAYDAAERASVSKAIAAAHDNALQYAAAAGLTLGSVESVSDATGGGYYFGGPPPFYGPFGPGKFCGRIQTPVFKKVKNHRRVARFRRVYRCIVPSFASLTLTVTYNAEPAGTTQTTG